MWEFLKECISSPIFGVILCGYLPGIIFLISAWRISKNGKITASSPNGSRQGWRKLATFKGQDVKPFVTTYSVIGVFVLVIATMILLSNIIH